MLKIKVDGVHEDSSFDVYVDNGGTEFRFQDIPMIRREIRLVFTESQKKLGYDIKYPIKIVYDRPVIFDNYFKRLHDEYGDTPARKTAIAHVYTMNDNVFLTDITLVGFGEEIMLNV